MNDDISKQSFWIEGRLPASEENASALPCGHALCRTCFVQYVKVRGKKSNVRCAFSPSQLLEVECDRGGTA